MTTQHSVINHCRWDRLSSESVLPALIFKRSLASWLRYVLDNFAANQCAANPILYTSLSAAPGVTGDRLWVACALRNTHRHAGRINVAHF